MECWGCNSYSVGLRPSPGGVPGHLLLGWPRPRADMLTREGHSARSSECVPSPFLLPPSLCSNQSSISYLYDGSHPTLFSAFYPNSSSCSPTSLLSRFSWQRGTKENEDTLCRVSVLTSFQHYLPHGAVNTEPSDGKQRTGTFIVHFHWIRTLN